MMTMSSIRLHFTTVFVFLLLCQSGRPIRAALHQVSLDWAQEFFEHLGDISMLWQCRGYNTFGFSAQNPLQGHGQASEWNLQQSISGG